MAYHAISFGVTTTARTQNVALIAEYTARWHDAQLYLNRLIQGGIDPNVARGLQTSLDNLGSEINLLDSGSSDESQFALVEQHIGAVTTALTTADSSAQGKLPWRILGWGLLAAGLGIGAAVLVISKSRSR